MRYWLGGPPFNLQRGGELVFSEINNFGQTLRGINHLRQKMFYVRVPTKVNSRTFQELNVCFLRIKCLYFQSNILASKGATIQLLGGGGGVAVFELNKVFTSFFHTLPQAEYLFQRKGKKILSTKFDPKLALVSKVKEPSEASLNKFKGRLIMPSEAMRNFFMD